MGRVCGLLRTDCKGIAEALEGIWHVFDANSLTYIVESRYSHINASRYQIKTSVTAAKLLEKACLVNHSEDIYMNASDISGSLRSDDALEASNLIDSAQESTGLQT